MNMDIIRAKARELHVNGAEVMNQTQLIQAIQMKEGNLPCFQTSWCSPMHREGCLWKDLCHTQPYFGG
jgi:hypothetical protein